MSGRLINIWIFVSVAAVVIGYICRELIPDNKVVTLLYFCGWLSSLLAIGYYSTPANSIFGKVLFSFVVIMVAGIIIKVLHLTGGNQIIAIGLLGIVVTYIVMWYVNKRTT